MRGIRAGVGFGDAEGLKADLPAGNLRQVAALLLLAAMTQERAHDIHLRMTGCRVAARAIDLFQDHARLFHREA